MKAVKLPPTPQAVDPAAKMLSDEWAVLAGMRFVLAICVAAWHYGTVIDLTSASVPRLITLLRVWDGPSCVVCFFLVSGYSIAASLEKSPVGYARRRFWRIAPVYWISLILALVPFAIVGYSFHIQDRTETYPGTLSAIINATGLPWILTPAVPTFSPCWSLTPEIIYYCIAPLLIIRPAYTICAVLTSVVCFLIFPRDDPSIMYIWPTIQLAWVWMIGFLYRQYRESEYAAPAMILLVLWLCGNRSLYVVTLAALVFGICIKAPKWLAGFAKYLGDLSYPLYLSHMPVYIILYLTMGHWMRHMPLSYLVVSVVASIVIYHIIDAPLRRFGKMGVSQPSPLL